MAVTETARCKLYVKLIEVLGQEHADTLMELLMQGYTARKAADLDDLRSRVERLEREVCLVKS